jgi:radical SAM superfamily enzyme YgiQ (UPF0313 family)
MDILYISRISPNFANFVRALYAEESRMGHRRGRFLRRCRPICAASAGMRTDLKNWRQAEQGINDLLEVKHAQGFEGVFDGVESHNEAWLRLEAFINERLAIPGITLRDTHPL